MSINSQRIIVFCMVISTKTDNFPEQRKLVSSYNIHGACEAQRELNFFRSQVNPNVIVSLQWFICLPLSDLGDAVSIQVQNIWYLLLTNYYWLCSFRVLLF